MGFNQRKHEEYLGDEGDIRNQFNEDVVGLLGSYRGEVSDVYEKSPMSRPNYEEWYEMGQINPEDLYKNHWVIQF